MTADDHDVDASSHHGRGRHPGALEQQWVERLVHEGMSPAWARVEVYGVEDGVVGAGS
jgi:hypothetical protein